MRKLALRVILLALGIFLTKNSLGQKIDTLRILNLDSAFQRALKNNPNHRVYLEQIRQSKYNLQASRSIFFPSISGSFNGQDNLNLAVTPIPGELIGKPGTTFNAQFGKKYAYNTGVLAQKDLFSWQNLLQTELAAGNYKLSKVQEEAYTQSLKEQVAKLYYSILVAKKSLDLGLKDKKIAEEMVKVSKNKLEQGIIDAITLNQAEINYNNILLSNAQSQQVLDQGIENLKIILGERFETELVLSEDLTPENTPYSLFTKVGNDKSLETYRMSYLISKTQIKLAGSVFLPHLSFQTFIGAQAFRNDFGLSFNSRDWSKYSYLGLNFTLPIFTGFNTANKYRSAKVQAGINKIQYEAAVNQSLINDRLLLKNQNDLSNALEASLINFQLYRKNLDLTNQKFLEGLVSLDVYLKSFQDYIGSENLMLSNISNLLSNQATLLSRL